MSPTTPTPGDRPELESLQTLVRALEEANVALARAHVEHEAVRERLGPRAPPPTTIVRSVPRPDIGGGAYRGKDERAELQRAVDEARLALATLRSDNSRLEADCDMKFPETPFGEKTGGVLLLALGGTAVIMGALWVVTRYGGKLAAKTLVGATFIVLFLLVRFVRSDRSKRQ